MCSWLGHADFCITLDNCGDPMIGEENFVWVWYGYKALASHAELRGGGLAASLARALAKIRFTGGRNVELDLLLEFITIMHAAQLIPLLRFGPTADIELHLI